MKALIEIPEEKEEEPDYELPESEEISTSLGSLFKKSEIMRKLLNRFFIEGSSGMACGLFVTLVLGTVLQQTAGLLEGKWLPFFFIWDSLPYPHRRGNRHWYCHPSGRKFPGSYLCGNRRNCRRFCRRICFRGAFYNRGNLVPFRKSRASGGFFCRIYCH